MKRVEWLWVGVLLAALAAQTLTAIRDKSPTCDEFAHHVPNGYSYLRTADFRMNPASPPLARMFPAIPWLFMNVRLPLEHESWKNGDSPEFARQFYYQANPGRLDELVFWSRLPVMVMSMFFGFFVYRYTRRTLGVTAAFVALTLYCFSPNILAHSGLATADLMVAFFFFMSCIAFGDYLRGPTSARLIMTGVLAGLTFLSKFSAVLLLPTFLIVGLFSGKARAISPRKTAAFLIVMALTIWAGYFFEVKPLLKNTPDPAKKIALIQKIGGEPWVRFAQNVPIPLSTFSAGLISMGFTRAAGTDAFFAGEWSRHGWWYYYLAAFAIKETVSLVLLVLFGAWWACRSNLDKLTKLVLLTPGAVFFVMTLRDKAPAGIRYWLPVFPFFFVIAGGFAAWLWHKRLAHKVLVVFLLSAHVQSALWISPDYLAYFSPIVGGPSQGHHYLKDSNIDWCQDLKGVGRWVEEQGYPEVALLYHGAEDPAYYHIPYRLFTETEYRVPGRTVYAIGAHRLDAVAWTRSIAPTHVVGRSFYIYDLRKASLPSERGVV